ncbi:hypothetical protein VT84_25425 [Gemmata sp. SH-PL17]|nr:hypothetical protein VT84_25425 [Gemmata sp. SH-PL17]
MWHSKLKAPGLKPRATTGGPVGAALTFVALWTPNGVTGNSPGFQPRVFLIGIRNR